MAKKSLIQKAKDALKPKEPLVHIIPMTAPIVEEDVVATTEERIKYYLITSIELIENSDLRKKEALVI
jgi:hypothetical protein